MKPSTVLFFSTLVLILLFFSPAGGLKELSFSFFQRIFEKEAAKEVFHLEEEEAVAVFGEKEEVFFV